MAKKRKPTKRVSFQLEIGMDIAKLQSELKIVYEKWHEEVTSEPATVANEKEAEKLPDITQSAGAVFAYDEQGQSI